jgi:hypothetical protein
MELEYSSAAAGLVWFGLVADAVAHFLGDSHHLYFHIDIRIIHILLSPNYIETQIIHTMIPQR